ncbi:MAG: helix-turn-helix transcriptional regulator [Bacteroidota bacterium]
MEKAFNYTADMVIRNIKKIRHYKNYSQDFIATKLDISQNAYSKIELGHSKISLMRFFQIASVLGVDESQLIKLDLSKLSRQ